MGEWVYDACGLQLPPEARKFEVFTNPRGTSSTQGRVGYRGPLGRAGDPPRIKLDLAADEVLATVDRLSLGSFADRVAAIDSRFDAVLVAAAELMEPKAQFVKLPHRTIKTDEDIEAWLLDAKQTIALALKKGPVILH